MENDDMINIDFFPEFPGTPPGCCVRIYDLFMTFCEYQKNPVDDLKKESQLFFASACTFVGVNYFKKLYPPAGCDYNLVCDSVPVWEFFCNFFDKVPTRFNFRNFFFLREAVAFGNEEGFLNPELRRFYSKIRQIEFGGLKERLTDGRQIPTGCIAILNNEFWKVGSIREETSKAITAGNLPILGTASSGVVQIAQSQTAPVSFREMQKAVSGVEIQG